MANSIDEHIGKRLRQRRNMLGLTQEKLGSMIGVTFQQIQKYERGHNRIGGSRMYSLCNALKIEPNFLFEELSFEEKKGGDPMLSCDSINLITYFNSIDSSSLRGAILEITKNAAKAV